jgi:S1 RNA binding domain protein
MIEQMGSVVQGKVVRIQTYGAFVELPSGETGLVHISEIAEEFVRSVAEHLQEGEDVMVKVLGRNDEDKLNLSIKQVVEQDFENMKFEKEMADVQRDISEREKITPRVEMRQPEEPKESPLVSWMGDANQFLTTLERKRLRQKQEERGSRERRRPRRNNSRRRGRPKNDS